MRRWLVRKIDSTAELSRPSVRTSLYLTRPITLSAPPKMSASVFSGLPTQAQSELKRLSAAVDRVLPLDVRSWHVDVAALPLESRGLDLLDEVSAWAGQSKACLYYFECHSQDVDIEQIERYFSSAKAHASNARAYPRLNAKRHLLYVGSSRSVTKRLREHLGYGANKTYALQLLHWARPVSLKLDFVCAKYADSTPTEVIEALEDALWKGSRPMFGRQGRK